MTTAAAGERPPKPAYQPFTGLPDLPALCEMRARPQWLAWDYVWRPEKAKWDKPPMNARTGGAGSSTDASTWSTYDQAAARASREGLPGVGYVLSPEVEDSGVDLDKCRDPETGILQAWAQVAVDFAETYTEVSPSGRGLRFFVKGLVDGRKIDAAQVEIYTKGRYLTVTGQHIPGTPTEIREAPRLIAYLQERADQFREVERAAADRARENERKKAEKHAAREPRPEPGPTVSERASASARQRGPREGGDFWRTVNDRALANLGAWVPSVFPGARWQAGTGAYRVEQSALGEGYEEDLSLHPDGIRDFGSGDMGDSRDGARTPIDVVEAYLPASDAAAAAMWLCDRLGIRPEDIGWRGGRNEGAERPRYEGPQSDPGPTAESPPAFRARPFVWKDPHTLPMREWLLGRHLIRKYTSATVSPGGLGKSSIIIVDALALVTGRNLIGHQPHGRHRAMIWNGEDPMDELQKRITAACLYFEIDRTEIEGRLFVNSGRDDPITVARMHRGDVVIAVPVVDALKATILANEIDVVFVDPFVSCHEVTENDNNAIDRVAKLWGRIAGETNCSIELVHHSRKTGGAEITVEDARGAVALLAAVRSARTLNGMQRDEAEKWGITDRGLYFRVDNGKANLAPPPSEGSAWFKKQSVSLGNGGSVGSIVLDGDSVGVVAAWEPPNPMDGVSVDDLRKAQAATREGRWRENSQARDWIGKPIAYALRLDADNKADRARIKGMLAVWMKTGMFVAVTGKDDKAMDRTFIEVGESAVD
jgi:hypothetical protein